MCVYVVGWQIPLLASKTVHTYRKRGESLRHSSKSNLTVIFS